MWQVPNVIVKFLYISTNQPATNCDLFQYFVQTQVWVWCNCWVCRFFSVNLVLVTTLSLLVILSDSVLLSEKCAMAKALLHHPKPSNKIVLPHIPLLTDDVSLVDLSGKYFLDTTSAPECRPWILYRKPNVLAKSGDCITAHNFVKNLNVAIDGSEHAFNLLTTFNTGNVTQRKK